MLLINQLHDIYLSRGNDSAGENDRDSRGGSRVSSGNDVIQHGKLMYGSTLEG